ncbi:MAG: zinc-binding dehydrogenase [Armatimonadota bacterium]
MRDIGIEYPAVGQMQFYDLGPPPALAPRQVLIRTHYSGITNGTERHALMGEHGFGPGRHGYQHVGTIEQVGSEVEDFERGDWVFYGRYVGHRGWHIQEVPRSEPDARGSHLCIKLPDDVEHGHCALFGVAGVSMRGIARCRVGPAQHVWVAGAGLIGQFAAQAARARGARVTVTDLDETRLAIAQELGADRVLDALAAAAVAALKDGAPYDCIIDACGAESLFHDINEHSLLRDGGVIAALAVRTDLGAPWRLLHRHEASIEVSCHFALRDLAALLESVREGVIRIQPLISHLVSIDEAPAIYATLRDSPADLLGVVFDWTR